MPVKRSSAVVYASKRVQGICEHCKWIPPVRTMLHAHHVVPIARGGPDVATNLIVLCPNCHAVAHWVTRQLSDVSDLTRQRLQVLMSHEVDNSPLQGDKRRLMESVRPLIDSLRMEMRRG